MQGQNQPARTQLKLRQQAGTNLRPRSFAPAVTFSRHYKRHFGEKVPPLLVDVRLDEPCQLLEGFLPSEIACLSRDDIGYAFLHHV